MRLRYKTKQINYSGSLPAKSLLKPAVAGVLMAVLATALPSAAAAQEPCFKVNVLEDFIWCDNWLPNVTLTATVNGFTTTATTDSSGTSVFTIAFDVHAGHTVTITDGHSTRSHVVTNVAVNSVDTVDDTVAGTADPGSAVRVMNMAGGPPPILDVVADGSGNWVADYSTIGFDLEPGHRGAAVQCENVWPNYNCTVFTWVAGQGGEPVGEIISYSGEVYVNETRVQDLGSLGLELLDRVRTFGGGYAETKFGETTVNLGPNSSMRVAETTTSTISSLDEVFGRMRARVENLTGQQLQVMTPQIVSSIRGTEMLIDATGEETRVIMLEHESDVSTTDGSQSIVLSELQGVVVTDAGIGEPFPVSPTEIERWWEWMGVSVACPVNLYVTDPLGRHVGCSPTGEIINEIPGATYTGPSSDPEEIGIPGPVRGSYGVCLTAVGTGPYSLSVAGMGLGEETFLDEYSGFIDEPDETVSYDAGYEQTGGTLRVGIDIKPGSFPNAVNPGSRGKIPVALLTDEDFDAATVDCETVFFGRTGTEAAPAHHAEEDVDGDGDIDVIFHFPTRSTGISGGETSAYLRGLTRDGEAFEGYDSIELTIDKFGSYGRQRQGVNRHAVGGGEVKLLQNRPNPLSGSTEIEFSVAGPVRVSMDVVTVEGKIVRTLLDELVAAGCHVIEWDGRDNAGRKVKSGVYFYRISSASGSLTRKVVILH